MTSPTEQPAWVSQRPRDRMYDFVLDRITTLSSFATRNCCEPNCGIRDEDGDVVSCSSAACGEKRLEEWHRRELQVMRDMRAFIEAFERSQIEKAAAADKATKGKKS